MERKISILPAMKKDEIISRFADMSKLSLAGIFAGLFCVVFAIVYTIFNYVNRQED